MGRRPLCQSYLPPCLLKFLCFFATLGLADAHGMMNRPSPRNNDGNKDFKKQPGCTGAACYWYSVGCISGCKCSGYEKDIVNGGYYMKPADAKCSNPTEPTLPEHARSWNIEGKSSHGDWTKYFPW